MNITIAALADFAKIAEGGKLNILGVFSRIHAERVPFVHPQMRLVVRFEFNSSEAGDKKYRIELVDEDGKALSVMDGSFEVERSNKGDPSTINLITRFDDMLFPKFGDYEFRVLLNGRTESIVPFAAARGTHEGQPLE